MKEVRVFAPATSANVACGYDILGFAVNEPGDEVTARLIDEPKVKLKKVSGDDGVLPWEPEYNAVSVPIIHFLKHINASKGVEIELEKKMPIGSGLGSSSASAVAGVVAANILFNNVLTKEELLPFTLESEKVVCGASHADNVAPSMLGGFVLIKSYNPLKVIKIPTPPRLYATIVHPNIIIDTEDARSVLRHNVDLKDVVYQCGNVGGLITGLFKEDYELIGESLSDILVEPHRAKLIPGFYQVKKVAIDSGALGSSISGSGPSIFALCEGKEKAEKVGTAMQEVFTKLGIKSTVYVSKINEEGPRVVT